MIYILIQIILILNLINNLFIILNLSVGLYMISLFELTIKSPIIFLYDSLVKIVGEPGFSGLVAIVIALAPHIFNKLKKQNWVVNGTVDNNFKKCENYEVTSANNIQMFITNLSDKPISFELNKIVMSFNSKLKIEYLNNSIGSKNKIEVLYSNLPTIQDISVWNALKPYYTNKIILENKELALLIKKVSDDFTDEGSKFESALSKYYVDNYEYIDNEINNNKRHIDDIMTFYNKNVDELKNFVNNYKYDNEISCTANILMNKILKNKEIRDSLKLCFQIEFTFEINNYSKFKSLIYHNKYNSIEFGGTFNVRRLCENNQS